MTITTITILLSLTVVSLTVYWLDARYNLKLAAWMNGEVSNPFTGAGQAFATTRETVKQKDDEIAALKARIETLETIVTEPAYELNQKLNRL